MVPDPNLDPSLHAGASEVLPGLDHFDPEKYGLPPFGDTAGAAAAAAGEEDAGPAAADTVPG
jgi:hypothetical protein